MTAFEWASDCGCAEDRATEAEQSLLLAVLERAIEDYKSENRIWAEDARKWLMSRDIDGVASFEYICWQFGWDANRLRREILGTRSAD